MVSRLSWLDTENNPDNIKESSDNAELEDQIDSDGIDSDEIDPDEIDSDQRIGKDDLLKASSEFFSLDMVRHAFLEGLEKKFIEEASAAPISLKSS